MPLGCVHCCSADSVKKVFNQTASALAAITVLKKVGQAGMSRAA